MKRFSVLAFAAPVAFAALAVSASSDVLAQSHSHPSVDVLAGLHASVEHATRAFELTLGLDLDDARRELAAGDPDDPNVALEKARLALYEGDCDGSAAILARPELAKSDEGTMLGDIARGCARVTAATVVQRDDAQGVEIRYQDEADRALTPLMTETVVKAREALTRDLGVTWPKPTRIVVVRDLLSLSAMTGLPYSAARTTGTVAVAKWGRVTLLSPRASRHGYAWRDTIAHELTHLAVTRASMDRAPLWLQEGVAKRGETRWREPGPMDDRPSPDAIVGRGIEMKLDIPLDKLGPSIAMLPSADAAMVAFAEVTSFVRHYVATAGPDALPRLLRALRERKSADAALTEITGSDLHGWDLKWRAALAAKPREPLPPMFMLGTNPPDLRDLRDRVRLAELLIGRGHPAQALAEMDRIKTPGALEDSSLRYLRATAAEAASKLKEAEAAVGEPKDVVAGYGPWWAIRGRFLRAAGDEPGAKASFFEAVAADPLDVEAACEGRLEISTKRDANRPPAVDPSPRDALQRPLCEAAKARGEPGLGQD